MGQLFIIIIKSAWQQANEKKWLVWFDVNLRCTARMENKKATIDQQPSNNPLVSTHQDWWLANTISQKNEQSEDTRKKINK